MGLSPHRSVLLALGFVLIGLLGGAVARAGTVRVDLSIDEEPFSFFQDYTTTNGTVNIAINGLTVGNSRLVFRVYDVDPVSGTPDDSVGSLSFAGTVQDGRIRVLVAAGVSQQSELIYPTDARQTLVVGLKHLGIANTPAVSFDANLLPKSHVAIAISGNLLGSVTSGRVTRVQALGHNDTNGVLVDGVISGNITSTQEDEYTNPDHFPPVWFRAGGLAIGQIVCNTLTGTVRANKPSAFDHTETIYEHTGSIDTIMVGEFHDGISQNFAFTGDVLAPAGRVQVIQIGCPILPPTSESPLPRIWAGNGVWEIKTFPVNILPRNVDVHAWIKTAWDDAEAIPGGWDHRFALPPSSVSPYYPDGNQTRSRAATYEQVLRRFEIGGDFVGTIEAKNISSPRYQIVQRGQNDIVLDWWGINILGSFTGRLDVRDRVLTASIRASTFIDPPGPPTGLPTVRIGTFLKGSVVATASDGATPTIQVGRHSLAELTDEGNDDRVGFIGSWNEPGVDMDDPTSVFWAVGEFRQEPDAMIRAHVIGTIDLASMNYGTKPEIPGPTYPSFKQFPPRIECPTIGSLLVDELASGVVWSGVRDGEINDFDNDYAVVLGAVHIGCAQDGVDLWLDTEHVTVTGNFGGRLHMNELRAAGVVMFGNFWNQTNALCAPTRIGGQGPASPAEEPHEDTPRNAYLSHDYTVAGVRIAQEGGLHGQIILGAAAIGESWSSTIASMSVYVGSYNPEAADGAVRFCPRATESPQPRLAPHYLTTSATLGGGAIGELPFGLHPIDSVPDYSGDVSHPSPHSRGGLASGDQPWTLAFYGPITFANTPVSVEFLDLTQQPPDWVGVTEAFAFAVSANGRDLELRGDGEPALAVGKYRVQPTSALLCNVDGAIVRVADFPGDGWAYMLATCTILGGHLHPADITDVGDTGGGPDGQLTYDDILLFINTFGDGAGCPGAAPCNVADITDVGDTGGGPDGQLTYDDLLLYVNSFGDGCFGGA